MAQFHITHVIPHDKLHILNGYNDVIRTIFWGLRGIGHDVTYAVNQCRADARNIIFGANMAHQSLVDGWPDNTILYNLEQVAPFLEVPQARAALLRLSNRFEIWDYSQANIQHWRQLNPHCSAKYVPIGFAPILENINPSDGQDIDVLIYGGPSKNRLDVFTEICLHGMTALYCFGLYGDARGELIARSKLVLNISHGHAEIFSIVRVSYLLANHKAVISDLNEGMFIEPDLQGALHFASLEEFPSACLHYLRDDDARRHLEEAAYAAMTKRDIRPILALALRD